MWISQLLTGLTEKLTVLKYSYAKGRVHEEEQ